MSLSANFITQTFIQMIENKGLFKFSSCSNELYVKGYSQNFKMKKIENAIKAYASDISEDDVLICLDATLMGSAKNGFILTANKMYWDGGSLSSKGVINFSENATFEQTRSGITFNGDQWVTVASLKKDILLEGLKAIFNEGKSSSAANSSQTKQQEAQTPEVHQDDTAAEAPATETSEAAILKNREKGMARCHFKQLLNKCCFFESDKALKNCFFLKGAHEPAGWEKRAQNAVSSYATGVNIDDILFLYDASITGNGKSGYILTVNELIWNTGLLGSKGRKSFLENINFLEENNAIYFQCGNEKKLLENHIGVNTEDLAWTLDQIAFITRAYKDFVIDLYQVNINLQFSQLIETLHDVLWAKDGVDKFVNFCSNMDTMAKNLNRLRGDFVHGTTIQETFSTKGSAEKFSNLVKENVTSKFPGFELESIKELRYNTWEQDKFDLMMQARTGAELNSSAIRTNLNEIVNKQKEIERKQQEIAKQQEIQRLKEEEALANKAYVRSHNGIFVDERDGNEYRIVCLGGKVWTAQNFRYRSSHSLVPKSEYWNDLDKEVDVNLFGRLYNWEEANQCAPDGWHLATKEEWEALLDEAKAKYGYRYTKALFHKEAWVDSETSEGYRGLDREPTNESGFGLLAPGHIIDTQGWCWLMRGSYWVRSQEGAEVDYIEVISDSDGEIKWKGLNLRNQNILFSVRYVKDNVGDAPLPPVYGYEVETEEYRNHQRLERENERRKETERRAAHGAEQAARRAAEVAAKEKAAADDLALDERRIKTARIARAWDSNPDVSVNLENDLGETLHINLGPFNRYKPYTFDSTNFISYYWADEKRTYSAQELAKKYGRNSKLGPTNWHKKK